MQRYKKMGKLQINFVLNGFYRTYAAVFKD